MCSHTRIQCRAKPRESQSLSTHPSSKAPKIFSWHTHKHTHAHTHTHTHTPSRAKPGETTVEHPCLLNGTNVTFHDGTTDGVQHAVGTSDHDACLELQDLLLTDCAHTPEGKCSPMTKVSNLADMFVHVIASTRCAVLIFLHNTCMLGAYILNSCVVIHH